MVALLLLVVHFQANAQDLPSLHDSIPASDRNKFLIFPVVARTPETSWNFGFAGTYIFHAHSHADTVTRTSTIPFGGVYTLNKQLVLGLGANVFFPGEKYWFRMESSFSSFPDKFWGIGNDTPDENEERYDFKQFFFNPILLRKVYPQLFLGVSYEYQRVYDFNFLPGGQFETLDVEGRYGNYTSGLGLVISRDSRNNAYSPNKGSLLQFTYTNFSRALGSETGFRMYKLDIRKFFKTAPTHVLALQAMGTFSSGNVPYRYMPVIGSPTVMRGYYSGRFRDKNLVAVQAEYRMPVWWRFGVVGFAGMGQVSDQIENVRFDSFKLSAGVGLRIALLQQEKFNLRLDYGFGNNSQAFYVIVSEAF
jgi:outer membrane protein assembly factor BamA